MAKRREHARKMANAGADRPPDTIGLRADKKSGQSEPEAMIRRQRKPWLWTNFINMGLGLWLITSPFTFGYLNLTQASEQVLRITAERDLPSIAGRAAAITVNDILSGLLIVLLSALALVPRPSFDFFGRWGVAVLGAWLGLAPLVFWAPLPAAFVTDTLVGVLVIAFSILVPMMPGMAHHMAMMKPGPEVPPGWSYNPSSWLQRAPIIALGLGLAS